MTDLPHLDPAGFALYAVPTAEQMAAARQARADHDPDVEDPNVWATIDAGRATVAIKHLLDGHTDLTAAADVIDQLADETARLAAAGFTAVDDAPSIFELEHTAVPSDVTDPGPTDPAAVRLPPHLADPNWTSTSGDEDDIEPMPVLYPKYDLPTTEGTAGEMVVAARDYAAYLRALAAAGWTIEQAGGHIHLGPAR